MKLWKPDRIKIFGVMGVIFLISVLVAAQNKNSKLKSSSVEGRPAITASYRSYSSYEDAFLTIIIRDPRGIDSLEIENLNSGDAILVNTLKSEPVFTFSDTYKLHEMFSNPHSLKSMRIRIAAKNVSGEANSLNVTLNFR